MGSIEFKEAYLAQHIARLGRDFDVIKQLLDPGCFDPTFVPSRQCLWALTLRCLQNQGSYLYHHVAPHITAAHAKQLDQYLFEIASLVSDSNLTIVSAMVQNHLRLPIHLLGCGLHHQSKMALNPAERPPMYSREHLED